MAPTVYRACYVTREEVKRALDVKAAAYSNVRIDRTLISSSESVEGLCQRNFLVNDDVRYKDWPNFDYSYPWRMWLDQDELADIATNVPVVNSGGVVIPAANILWGDPTRPRAPFTYFELRRDKSSSFGNGPSPQREVSITGTFGYWLQKISAGNLAAAVIGAGDATITVTEGDTPGIGDIAFIENERMIVTDSSYVNTTFTVTSGCTTSSMGDNVLVPSGGTFTIGETIQIDSEWMLIQGQTATGYIVKRAFDGSILNTHSGGTAIWARRVLSVLRGQLGTTAVAHSNNLPISILAIPGMVKDLALAESIATLTGEVSGYSEGNQRMTPLRRTVSATSFNENTPGTGIHDLRERTATRYGRQARSRVI